MESTARRGRAKNGQLHKMNCALLLVMKIYVPAGAAGWSIPIKRGQ